MTPDAVFQSVIQKIVTEDHRYREEAYAFIAKAVMLSLSCIRREEQLRRHVSAEEIIFSLCALAHKEYGPLALIVLKDWGIRTNTDIANVIYHLIAEEVLQEGPGESITDFARVKSIDEVLGVLTDKPIE